jgi:hypothetical protein
MYNIGDLVIVNDDCAVSNYRGKLAIVIKNLGNDPIELTGGCYFKLQFANGRHEILTASEMTALSKAERK